MHIERARPRGAADPGQGGGAVGSALDAGDAEPGLDADAVSRWLTMMTWRVRRHLVRGADDAEIARMAGGYAALLWNVLYAGRAADHGRATARAGT